jgi:hypothetical protein
MDVKECSSTGDKTALAKYRAEREYEREYGRSIREAQEESDRNTIKSEPVIKEEESIKT